MSDQNSTTDKSNHLQNLSAVLRPDDTVEHVCLSEQRAQAYAFSVLHSNGRILPLSETDLSPRGLVAVVANQQVVALARDLPSASACLRNSYNGTGSLVPLTVARIQNIPAKTGTPDWLHSSLLTN